MARIVLSQLRRERRWLRVAGVLLLLVAIAAIIVADPLRWLVATMPMPDLPNLPDLPDLPNWVRWLRIALVVSLVVIALAGVLEKRSGQDETQARDE